MKHRIEVCVNYLLLLCPLLVLSDFCHGSKSILSSPAFLGLPVTKVRFTTSHLLLEYRGLSCHTVITLFRPCLIHSTPKFILSVLLGSLLLLLHNSLTIFDTLVRYEWWKIDFCLLITSFISAVHQSNLFNSTLTASLISPTLKLQYIASNSS